MNLYKVYEESDVETDEKARLKRGDIVFILDVKKNFCGCCRAIKLLTLDGHILNRKICSLDWFIELCL